MAMGLSPKMGPLSTPGGLLGAANEQAINDTVQVIGPLTKDLAYTVEGDVDMWCLQGDKEAIGEPGAAVITAAQLRQYGTPIPAGVEWGPFQIGTDDGYVAWVKDAAAPNGTKFRCHHRASAKTA